MWECGQGQMGYVAFIVAMDFYKTLSIVNRNHFFRQ